MKLTPILARWILLSVLALALAACSPKVGAVAPAPSGPLPASTSTAGTFTDPFAYCAAIGTVDTPDARYVGPPIPDEIINGFKKAAGWETSTEPIEMFRKTTIWRCMNGKLYACNFGANLACDSKANTDTRPSQALQDYCRANPDSDVIPMSVTGHDTIYSWHCIKDNPQILRQIGQADAAGYLSQIWYAIEPGP